MLLSLIEVLKAAKPRSYAYHVLALLITIMRVRLCAQQVDSMLTLSNLFVGLWHSCGGRHYQGNFLSPRMQSSKIQ
jgi:hypothetical protein